MTDEWFYQHAGRLHGPVSLTDLIAAFRFGFLHPSDLVCRRIVQGWAPARHFTELSGAPHPETTCDDGRDRTLGTGCGLSHLS